MQTPRRSQFADLLVDTAATVRLTRLVLEDEITEDLRFRALNAIDAHVRPAHPYLADKLEYLLGCPWCISFWAGAALFTLRRISPETADIVSGALAASLVTGVLHEKLDI